MQLALDEINLNSEKRRDFRLLPLLLARSGDSPLDVRIELSSEYGGHVLVGVPATERHAALRALLPHVSWIKKLYIRYQTRQLDGQEIEVLRMLDAGLDFPLLAELVNVHTGRQTWPVQPDNDTSLDIETPNLRILHLEGTRPRSWTTLLPSTLVNLDVTEEATPIDMDFLATVFQQCRPQPIVGHMLRGLAPLVSFEVYTDQDIVLRESLGRIRRFRVDDDDDNCYETGALWDFLVRRYDAQRTVRKFRSTTKAWSWITRVFERHQPELPTPESEFDSATADIELHIIPSYFAEDFQKYCHQELHVAGLAKLLLEPVPELGHYQSLFTSAEPLLHILRQVSSARRGVIVCLGELRLPDVPRRRYVAEYAAFAEALANIRPAEMWVPCAHCESRAKEFQNLRLWCIHCGDADNEVWRDICDDRWHTAWY
ncbi:hypothetical protein C8R43DRAFT_1116925 [Mycena crocata]|nr:hypothetical protein C8R43DRAFT_1116925 [Mycena crocata]